VKSLNYFRMGGLVVVMRISREGRNPLRGLRRGLRPSISTRARIKRCRYRNTINSSGAVFSAEVRFEHA